MSLLPTLDNLWLYVAVIAGLCVLGILKTISLEAAHALRWHDLRIRVQQLRIQQKRQLEAMEHARLGAPKRSDEVVQADLLPIEADLLEEATITTPAAAA